MDLDQITLKRADAYWPWVLLSQRGLVSAGFTGLIERVGGDWLLALLSGFGMGHAYKSLLGMGVFCFCDLIFELIQGGPRFHGEGVLVKQKLCTLFAR